jgi:ABC-type Fe3+ transport system substrate-binding protein
MAAEPGLVAVGTTDVRSITSVVWPAFQRDHPDAPGIDYRQDLSLQRVRDAIRGPDPSAAPDVVLVSDPALLAGDGLLAEVDVETDGMPAGWTDPARRWVPLYVQPVVAIWNAYRGTAPRTWQDLASPVAAGRLVFEEPWRMLTSGPALAELSAVLAADAWDALVGGMAANAPELVADNERSVLEVAIGSRWVGLSNWNVARRVRPGSPVRYTFLDRTPCVPGFGAVVSGARHADLAARFVHWLSTDAGQRAYAATGRIPSRIGLDVPTRLDRVLPTGVQPLLGGVPWASNPEPWIERFRERFGAGERSRASGDSAREGKQAGGT